MFVVEPKRYTIKDVAYLCDVTPDAILMQIRSRGMVKGVPIPGRPRQGSRFFISESVYKAIRAKCI